MKKNVLALGGGVVVVVTAMIIALLSSAPEPTAKHLSVGHPKVSYACRIFTQADARSLLGPAAKLAAGNGMVDAISESAEITSCRYVQGAKYLTLFVRLENNAEGAAYNKAAFGEHRPPGKQTIHDVGDAAFWDETISQLFMLRGSTMYVVESTPAEPASDEDLSAALAVYQRLKSRL